MILKCWVRLPKLYLPLFYKFLVLQLFWYTIFNLIGIPWLSIKILVQIILDKVSSTNTNSTSVVDGVILFFFKLSEVIQTLLSLNMESVWLLESLCIVSYASSTNQYKLQLSSASIASSFPKLHNFCQLFTSFWGRRFCSCT